MVQLQSTWITFVKVSAFLIILHVNVEAKCIVKVPIQGNIEEGEYFPVTIFTLLFTLLTLFFSFKSVLQISTMNFKPSGLQRSLTLSWKVVIHIITLLFGQLFLKILFRHLCKYCSVLRWTQIHIWSCLVEKRLQPRITNPHSYMLLEPPYS